MLRSGLVKAQERAGRSMFSAPVKLLDTLLSLCWDTLQPPLFGVSPCHRAGAHIPQDISTALTVEDCCSACLGDPDCNT